MITQKDPAEAGLNLGWSDVSACHTSGQVNRVETLDDSAFPPDPLHFHPSVSIVGNAEDQTTRVVSPGEIISKMRNGEYGRKIRAIRSLYAQTLRDTNGDAAAAKESVGELKKQLQGVMWSGEFSKRVKPCKDHLTKYSHLLCADLDHLDEQAIMRVIRLAETDPHVFTAFRSPTNTGIKVVFRVGGDAPQHAENFAAVRHHVKERYGLEVDKSCKDIGRLCFVSDSPGAWWNNHATALEPIVEAKPVAASRQPSTPMPNKRRAIAERLLGAIQWRTDTEGYCDCPGKDLHTSGNGTRDCTVYIAEVPTIFCLHESCSSVVERVNSEFRSQVGKAERQRTTELTVSPRNGAPVVINANRVNTELMFADLLEQDLGPTKTVGSDWFTYECGRWAQVSKATLRPKAQNILPAEIRTTRLEGTILDHLEGRLQIRPDSFKGFHYFTDSGDILLNVENGVLRVSATGELRLEPHSPEHLFLHKLASSYDPKATAPLFRRVLGEALPDDEDQIVYQLCAGNFLFPDSRHEVALVNYGEAGRSKSTCAEPVAGAIGKDLVPRLTMSQLCDSRSYYVPKLRYAAVNLGTELDAVELDDSGAFKAIVSGEEIEARSIYGAPFTMATTCKLWFLANSLPRFKHGTEAELRRTRFLRFDYEPPQKDVTLKSRLRAETNGVFLWMVNGLLDLMTLSAIPRGGAESRRVHDRFRVSNDPVGAFVSTCCVIDPAASISKDTMRDAYREFCEKHGLPVTLGEWFFRVLYERWPNLKDVRRRQEGERVQAICGIQLKP